MTQKQRSLGLLGAVALLALALAGYAWFGVYQPDQAEKAQKDVDNTLFSFKKDQVKGLGVTSRGQTVEATKDGDNWEIQSPIKAAGDKFTFDTIADRLAGLKQKRDVGVQSDLKEFGLDAPKSKVVVTVDDGKTVELDLGADNAFDGTVYAKRGSDSRVSILESAVKFPLDKGLFDLRDKRLVVFEDPQVKHLDVAAQHAAFGLDRTNEGKWKLTAPQAMDADTAKSNGLLNTLKNLKATRFESDQSNQGDLSRTGLDRPVATVQLLLDKDQQRTLTFGTVKENNVDHTYGKVADQAWIAEVPNSILKDLDLSLDDLRDKTILSFDQNAVRGFKFSVGGDQFAAQRRGGGDAGGEAWTYSPVPPGGSTIAKKWKLSSLASQLHELKGAKLVSVNADTKLLSSSGLEHPARSAVVLGEGDAVLATLELGNAVGANFYARAAGSPRVFELEGFKLGSFPANAADLAETPPDAGGASLTAAVATPGGAAAQNDGGTASK